MTDLLARMGINVRDLGCVMLDVAPLTELHNAIPPSLWYSDPKTPWINGPSLDAHVTLLFGLLKSAHEWREFVDEVLDDWTPPPVVEVFGFDVFGRDSDPYDCIVGTIHQSTGTHLRDANKRLRQLPHVETFPYLPHLTIGYVLKGTARLVIPELREIVRASKSTAAYGDRVLQSVTGAINYGDEARA